MPNLINKMIVRELSEVFDSAEGMIMCTIDGLSVAETEELRNSLAEKGIRLRMIRNRLARLALKERGIEAPVDMLVGNVACAWGSPEDAITAAKVLHTSNARKEGKVAFRGGLFEGELLGPAETTHLAQLPGKDELRAMMLGVLSAPARNLVGLLAAPGGSLARVIQARIDAGPPEKQGGE